MTAPAKLLAKGRIPGRADVTLEAHLRDTACAARAIFKRDSRLARRWAAFFRVAAEDDDRFLVTLEVASLLHDIGKANEDFLAAVTRGGGQTLRHEHLSALVLCLPEVRGWLARAEFIDVDVLTASVLAHHYKADDKSEYRWCQPRGPKTKLALLLGHDEVRRVLDQVGRVAGIGAPPALTVATWSADSPWLEGYRRGLEQASAFRRAILRDPRRRSLLLAVKTGLVVADAASSALVREGHPIEARVEGCLHSGSLSGEAIEQAVLAPRRRSIEARGRAFAYHRFQELAGDQGPRSLLLAACGAGKTIAAWRWLKSMASAREIGSVVFLYPTRGTATEGFRDYVGWAPEAEVALLHGSARYELDRILENPPESLAGKSPGRTEAEARLFGLGMWGKRYFSATVDQFLAFLEHGYASTCLLPRLVDSAIVIDEVHSFDRRLFDDLVAFLTAFDVPVLCMTATLAPSRRGELEATGLVTFPRAEHREDLVDLEAAESHPRYDIEVENQAERAFEAACHAVRAGNRVLWVANTVARCQAQSARFSEVLGAAPITYHSRFRLVDRQARHAETVAAFQGRRNVGTVAVTTQVCEMSLDLDADVLITELAPISSLVQRFGRANRHAKPGSTGRGRVIVLDVASTRPYEREELDAAREFVAEIAGNGVSQRTLAEALERHARREPRADGAARLLTSGYFAVPGNLRDTDDSGGPSVLDSDVPEVLRRIGRRLPFDELVVPSPRGMQLPREDRHGGLPGYLGIVPGEHYSERTGLAMEGRR